MDEFNSRTDVQRKTLSIVNTKFKKEPLFGLSKGAIDRWSAVNLLPEGSLVVRTLVLISEKLSFLANKSQQQITKEYQDASKDIESLLIKLSKEYRSMNH